MRVARRGADATMVGRQRVDLDWAARGCLDTIEMAGELVNYYNEFDPHAAQWIRNLIAAGHIPNGVVDERSIEDVTPADLAGYTQCHFFAGIAGWSLALRRAGVPDDYPIWTGSCPCQPFSAAGKGAGFDDPRHLWPAFYWLIAHCKPAVVVGEQVASKAVDTWIDLVHADMEAVGYAFGSVPFPSASVGAPHIRDRNYWVGHADNARLEGHTGHGGAAGRQGSRGSVAQAGLFGGMAHADRNRCAAAPIARLHNAEHHAQSRCGTFGLAHTEHDGRDRPSGIAPQQNCDESNERLSDRDSAAFGLAHAGSVGRQVAIQHPGRSGQAQSQRETDVDGSGGAPNWPGPTNGHWRAADWLGCRDGKWRPVEPGTFPLAHGVSNRVGRLRAYGNAINPTQAAEFLKAILY